MSDPSDKSVQLLASAGIFYLLSLLSCRTSDYFMSEQLYGTFTFFAVLAVVLFILATVALFAPFIERKP